MAIFVLVFESPWSDVAFFSRAWNAPALPGNKPATEPRHDDKKFRKVDPPPLSNTEKDPEDWVSGDEPMTGAQASYLKTLTEQLGQQDESTNP